MMSGSKAPDFDTYGLLRATHSLVSAPLRSVLNMCHWHIAPYPIFAYRGIIIPLLCSYRGGSKGLSPTYEQAHVGLDLLALVSSYFIKKIILCIATILYLTILFAYARIFPILGSSSHRITDVVLVVITLVKPQAVANRAVHVYRNGTRLLLYVYHAVKVFFCVINKGSGYII